MKLELSAGAFLAALAVGGVAVGWWYRREIAHAVGNAVNPASSDNLVNRGVESIGQAVTGDASWTPGGALWDFWSNDDFAEQLKVQPRAPRPTTGDLARADRAADAAREAAPIYAPGYDFGGTFGYGAP